MSTPVDPIVRKKGSAVRTRSLKAPSVQSEIIARRIAGQNKTSIAKDLGIARNTVTNVLELNDIERMYEDGRIGSMKRIPKALKTLDVRLEKNSEAAALWVLDKCFDGNETRGNRMSNDVFLQQTLNVLLHDGEPAKVDSETRTVEQTAIASDTPQDK